MTGFAALYLTFLEVSWAVWLVTSLLQRDWSQAGILALAGAGVYGMVHAPWTTFVLSCLTATVLDQWIKRRPSLPGSAD